MQTTAFGHLVPGRRYRVVREFIDFDRGVHPVGEEWTFVGHSFLPYDDGLSLFVSTRGDDRVRQTRMRWTPEDQGPVVDALRDYVALLPANEKGDLVARP